MAPGAGLDSLGLGFRIWGDSADAENALDRVRANVAKTRGAVEQDVGGIGAAFKKFGTLATGVAMLGGAFALAEKAGKFVDAIEQTGIRAGATEHEVEKLRAAALDVGLKGFATSAETAGETLEMLATYGMSANEAMQALNPSLLLAGISMGALGKPEAAKTLSMVLRQFRLGAGDAAAVVDQMTVATRAFKIPIQEVPELLRGVGLGAQAAKASFSDTLITLGLTRQALPETSQSIRSVQMAMQQLASPQLHKRMMQTFGVPLEAGGKMRPVVDVLTDIVRKTENLGEAKVQQKLAGLFGPRGYGGMSVVVETLRKGVTTSSGEVLRGAAAIDYYRKMLDNAGGAAAGLRAKLRYHLDTQVADVKAKISTIVSLLGEPFEEAFIPIMEQVAKAFAWFGKILREIPKPIMEIAAKVVIFGGAAFAVVGVLKLLAPLLPLVAGGIAAVAGSLAKLTLLGGPLLLVGMAFHLAWSKNLGSMGDTTKGFVAKVSLAWSALSQLFSRGWMSADVWAKLSTDDNAPVLGWVRRIWLWGNRIKNFGVGLWESFSSGIERAEPIFARFAEALGRVATALGVGGLKDNVKANAQAFDEWGRKGNAVGGVLATIAGVGTDVLAHALDTIAALITQARKDWPQIKQDFHNAAEAMRDVGGAIRWVRGLFGGLTGDAKSSMSAFGWLGMVIGWVGTRISSLGPLVKGIGAAFNVLRGIIGNILNAILMAVEEVMLQIYPAAKMFGKGAAVEGWLKSTRGARERIASWSIKGYGDYFDAQGKAIAAQRAAALEGGMSVEPGTSAAPVGPMSEEAMAMPEGPPPGIFSPSINVSNEETVKKLDELLVAVRQQGAGSVYLDGEKVGAVQKRRERAESVASFDPAMTLVSE